MNILFHPRPVSQMNITVIDGEQFVEITDEAAKDIMPHAYMISESGRVYSNLTNKFIVKYFTYTESLQYLLCI